MGTNCSLQCDCSESNKHQNIQKSLKYNNIKNGDLDSSMQSYLNKHRFQYFERFSKKEIKQIYTLEKALGDGHFGQVIQASSKFFPSKKYAIKTISKLKISDKMLLRLEQELEILEKIDHPNLIKYHATHVDQQYIYIVTELCQGGEVFHRVQEQKKLNEQTASKIIYQILLGVKYLHDQGICHRDLKPENIMFADQNSEEIKIIDFGLSKQFQQSELQQLNSVVGTPYYVAPEVLSTDYDERCDIWSIGVILYILLCGYPPFNGKSTKEVISKIKRGHLIFDKQDWKGISREGRDLVNQLLKVDLGERISIDQALQHQWFSQFSNMNKSIISVPGTGCSTMQSIEEIDKSAFAKLINISELSEFENEMMTFISRNIDSKDQEILLKHFKYIDNSGSGKISLNDFKLCAKDSDMKISDKELEQLFNRIDRNSKGYISFTDFMVAAIRKGDYVKQTDLKYAFQYYDTDQDGFITLFDLQEIDKRRGHYRKDNLLQDIIIKSTNGKRRISYEKYYKIITSIIN